MTSYENSVDPDQLMRIQTAFHHKHGFIVYKYKTVLILRKPADLD